MLLLRELSWAGLHCIRLAFDGQWEDALQHRIVPMVIQLSNTSGGSPLFSLLNSAWLLALARPELVCGLSPEHLREAAVINLQSTVNWLIRFNANARWERQWQSGQQGWGEGVDRVWLNPQPNVQMERPQFHGAINQVSLVAQWRSASSGSGRCAGLQLGSCKRGAVAGFWN